MKNIIIRRLWVFTTLLIFISHAAADDVGIRLLDKNSAAVDWLHSGKWIAYTKTNTSGDGYHDIWLVKPNATGHTCLSRFWSNKKNFPHKRVGGAAWHPS